MGSHSLCRMQIMKDSKVRRIIKCKVNVLDMVGNQLVIITRKVGVISL